MKKVRDIMEADTVNISPDATVRELAEILNDEQISGAPVVDAQGNLVGVVSTSDIVRLASEPRVLPKGESTWLDELEETDPDYVPSFFLDVDSYPSKWTPLSDEPMLASFDDATVKDIMTSVPFTIPAETSVAVLADFLSERRIHRAVVMGKRGIAGIVTTFDVLRACQPQGRDQLTGN